MTLTADRLRQLLSYDPKTGRWWWLVNRRGNVKAGDEAGCYRTDGYHHIRVDGRLYMSHRLAFLYMTGAWPVHEGDHRNTDISDNRWENLRDATKPQNLWNARRSKANKSGFKGVSRAGKRWLAVIWINGGQKRLGLFDTPEEAHAAYVSAAIQNRGDFARY